MYTPLHRPLHVTAELVGRPLGRINNLLVTLVDVMDGKVLILAGAQNSATDDQLHCSVGN